MIFSFVSQRVRYNNFSASFMMQHQIFVALAKRDSLQSKILNRYNQFKCKDVLSPSTLTILKIWISVMEEESGWPFCFLLMLLLYQRSKIRFRLWKVYGVVGLIHMEYLSGDMCQLRIQSHSLVLTVVTHYIYEQNNEKLTNHCPPHRRFQPKLKLKLTANIHS